MTLDAKYRPTLLAFVVFIISIVITEIIALTTEYFDKIFVLFQHLHAREEYNRTGIGLPFVQRILENMGFQIRVESELNKSSSFIFTIPK